MRLSTIVTLALLCACQENPHKDSNKFTNGHQIQLKDSVLVKTIREYMDTFHLSRDSVVIFVNASSNPLDDEMVFYIDYTQFDDFIVMPNQLPSYLAVADSTLITIYNDSDRYVAIEKIEEEIRAEMDHYGIHLKKWDMKIYDPPLWKIRRHGDTVLIDRPRRR
jgi:hypothetical protein